MRIWMFFLKVSGRVQTSLSVSWTSLFSLKALVSCFIFSDYRAFYFECQEAVKVDYFQNKLKPVQNWRLMACMLSCFALRTWHLGLNSTTLKFLHALLMFGLIYLEKALAFCLATPEIEHGHAFCLVDSLITCFDHLLFVFQDL